MDFDRLAAMTDQVYGYAVNRTSSREEADELSQKIMLAALQAMPKLRDETRFEPWLWALAANVNRGFRRDLGRQRAMYAYNMPENLPAQDPWDDEQAETYGRLRERIAHLSSLYRDILILFYYDGLSVKEISLRLGIPEGTVTWRLSEARRKIKKEWNTVKESALRPVTMRVDIYGSGNYDGKVIPFPSEFVNDALSQNILYQCYETPKTTEELAEICGVPAYYVEESLKNLLKREAVIEPVRGKYQADLIIWTDEYGKYGQENAERLLHPLMPRLLDALDAIARDAAAIDFYRAGKSESDLYCLYGTLALCYAEEKFSDLPCPPIPVRYDGHRWRYIASMESGQYKRVMLSRQHCNNENSRGHFTHTVFSNLPGFGFRQMMYDNWINCCEDILLGGGPRPEDAEFLAGMEAAGYIERKEDGSLFVTVPMMTAEQKASLDAVAEKHLAPLMPEYLRIVKEFISGYIRLFPGHLRDDALRMCQGAFTGMYGVILRVGQETGRIQLPAPGSILDVMLQKKQ